MILRLNYQGELSAYLRRQFGSGIQKSPALLKCLVEEEGYWIFSISMQDWQGMLYCSEDPNKIDAISLQFGSEPKEDVEYIVDSYNARDFTILLTSIHGSLKPIETEEALVVPSNNMIYQSISDGDLLRGLAQCIQLVDGEPYNKQAYWAGLILAEQLRVHSQGLMLSEMALSHFPNEKMFLKRRIECTLRLGEFESATQHWDDFLKEGGESTEDLLSVIICIHQNRYSKAMRILNKVKSTNSKVTLSKVWLRKLLLYRTLTSRLVWLSIWMWIGFGLWINIAFIGLIVMSVAIFLWSEFAFRKRLQVALTGKGVYPIDSHCPK